MTRRRIALYTHSTNPRGGVVHTLELGDALARAGYDVTIHAPDPTGQGFFRRTAARHVSIPAAPAPASLPAMMVQRIAEISGYIRVAGKSFDIHHAQDTINANALLAGIESGQLRAFVRTVHHVDSYADPTLLAWQSRGIRGAARCFCVSAVWQEFLAREHALHADIVQNGVSLTRFTPHPVPRDQSLRAELGLGAGPIYLAIGGIEGRKNTINILRAFQLCLQAHPAAQLIIAGGASLLDHSTYQATFHAELAPMGIADHVFLTGPMPDDDMPSLYRIADALVFPSVKEGFGLVVLEALASETPVIVSRIPPFTEYLSDFTCSFADPQSPPSIAAAMQRALTAAARRDAIQARNKILPEMSWEISAARHASLYESLCAEAAHA
jgi:glycosyltransferase-like protein